MSNEKMGAKDTSSPTDENVMEEEISQQFEKKAEEWAEGLDERIEAKVKVNAPKYAEPIAGVIFMTIFLVLVNLYWDRFSFITEDFADLLPTYNAIVVVGIVINLIRIFVHSKLFKVIGDFVNAALMVFFSYLLWTVYPFDVEGIWDFVIKFMIIVPTGLTILAAFVELGKLMAEEKK